MRSRYRRSQIAFFAPLFALFILAKEPLAAQTIEDKLAEKQTATKLDVSSSTKQLNQTLTNLRESLDERYSIVEELVRQNAEEEEFEDLLDEINFLKKEISHQEAKFYRAHRDEIAEDSEDAAIWQQEDISLSQLIMEYGGGDCLYVIPPELNSLKLQMLSSLPIPRSNWPELLELILNQNGVGVKRINSYVKQLFLLKQDFTSVTIIASKRYELEALDAKTRLIYIYAPPVEHLKTCYYFLERFRDTKTSHIYQVGSKIAIVATKDEVSKLLTLSEQVWEAGEEKKTKVVSLSKVSPDEMTKILKAFFVGLADPNRSVLSLKGGHDLSVVPLQHENSLALIGSQSLVRRAEDLIRQTEGQVEDPNEVTVYWYTCSHSSPTELSEILEKVYNSLLYSSIDSSSADGMRDDIIEGSYLNFPPPERSPAPHMEDDPYAPIDSLRYAPQGQGSYAFSDSDNIGPSQRPANFIAHPATGSILMVVRKDVLPKIKETLKHLDIPKRMVEIEVLLCERRFTDTERSGINLLKIGSNASGQNASAISFDSSSSAPIRGLLEFLVSRPATEHFPAFDAVFNFLLSQDDIRVTASPSLTTINQTPATIAITDQISINNGASPVSSNTGVIFKDSFERADFGITITLTPTVHEPSLDDPNNDIYITLENDISFETIKNDNQSRPDVHQRKVKNQVRIADGQTIILGGLRSRSQEGKNEKIPFLGEIPGFGKLFGTSVLTEKNNEMFIFIKPRVIKDPQNDLIKIRERRLRYRPGDSDLILDKIREGRARSTKRSFQRSFELLVGGNHDYAPKL